MKRRQARNRIHFHSDLLFQDFNDNAPQFISPPANYTIKIAENASIGQEVIVVRAVDTDIGANGQVRYRIRKDPLGNFRSFRIDPESGVITLVRELDRERQKIYDIRVEAYDLGVPTSLQSDLDLTIYVRNVNDHKPQFLVDTFVANFTEHKLPGLERNLLVSTVDRDDEDEDADHLESVCYYIVGGDDEGTFQLLAAEHELVTTRELDRESRSNYSLVVRASEDCPYVTPDTRETGVQFDQTDDSLLLVRVFVNDIDDNPPFFTRSVFTGGISTDIEFGTAFMTITAEDPDSPANSVLQYSLDGEIVPSRSSEGLDDIRQPPFLIHKDSGELILNFDPQKGMKGYFDFGVRVYDGAGHVDKAKVQIYLLREDQRIKFVMRSQPGEIRPEIHKFQNALADVTDAIVNVDGFKTHENPDGSMDKTKTDVLFHFVNPRDNSVMEVEDVLKLIDYRTEELVEVFREFNVLNTEGVDPSFVRKASSETVIMYWLLGICVFLTILLILTLCLCVRQRNRYLRKLRAATTSAYGDTSAGVLNKREIVPNTNRHASEGSNPIWLSGVGYDNLEFSTKDEEDARMIRSRNNLNQLHANLDSLDANVLNESIEDHNLREDERTTATNVEDDDDDIGYAASHFSNGGSTLRVGSFGKLESPLSGSSGLGSGNSRKFAHNDLNKGGPNGSIYSKNMTISALFPSQMPPIEKLGSYGNTTYDEDDIPRTEL